MKVEKIEIPEISTDDRTIIGDSVIKIDLFLEHLEISNDCEVEVELIESKPRARLKYCKSYKRKEINHISVYMVNSEDVEIPYFQVTIDAPFSTEHINFRNETKADNFYLKIRDWWMGYDRI